VDRLGDPYHRIPGVAHRGRDRERVIAADRDQAVDARGAQQTDDLFDPALLFEGIGPRGAKDGAAERKDATDRCHGQVLEIAVPQQASPAILDAADLKTALERAAGYATDGGVESGGVATAREDADAHDA